MAPIPGKLVFRLQNDLKSVSLATPLVDMRKNILKSLGRQKSTVYPTKQGSRRSIRTRSSIKFESPVNANKFDKKTTPKSGFSEAIVQLPRLNKSRLSEIYGKADRRRDSTPVTQIGTHSGHDKTEIMSNTPNKRKSSNSRVVVEPRKIIDHQSSHKIYTKPSHPKEEDVIINEQKVNIKVGDDKSWDSSEDWDDIPGAQDTPLGTLNLRESEPFDTIKRQ